jgi:6-phosphofructokinase 1
MVARFVGKFNIERISQQSHGMAVGKNLLERWSFDVNHSSNQAMKQVCELDFQVPTLGEATIKSPMSVSEFVDENRRIAYFQDTSALKMCFDCEKPMPSFEVAGPRPQIYHDPTWARAAIVTCGGLCPGINDVIKSLVNTLWFRYGVQSIYGIRYGYRGLVSGNKIRPIDLNPDLVDNIHENGGSMLGSSRGPQPTEEILKTLSRLRVNILFTIGGDGTQRGAREIAEAAMERGMALSVIGIPKTIDNDLNFMDRTFGFETAVYATGQVISCAHDEAKGTFNGIGLVKLMGRESGFIAAYASLANSFVNFCIIPEDSVALRGENGLLAAVERRLKEKDHCVIVVAEGAGQEWFDGENDAHDASGNVKLRDVGTFLEAKLGEHLSGKGIEHSVKYFDPSYIIRSVPARGTDAVFCLNLAENAVHAAMAGKTSMVIGHWFGSFVHVPTALAVRERRKINPDSQFWHTVLGATRQYRYFDKILNP